MEAELDFNKCSDETLIDIYRKGDEAAIEVLFERYKDIVRKKAKAMYLAGGDSDDLIQEGMIGIMMIQRRLRLRHLQACALTASLSMPWQFQTERKTYR